MLLGSSGRANVGFACLPPGGPARASHAARCWWLGVREVQGRTWLGCTENRSRSRRARTACPSGSGGGGGATPCTRFTSTGWSTATGGGSPVRFRPGPSSSTGGVGGRGGAARAADLGMPALALTDRDGLYGAFKHVQACADAGIKPLLGVDLPLLTSGEKAARAAGRVTLLAVGRQGWAS